MLIVIGLTMTELPIFELTLIELTFIELMLMDLMFHVLQDISMLFAGHDPRATIVCCASELWLHHALACLAAHVAFAP